MHTHTHTHKQAHSYASKQTRAPTPTYTSTKQKKKIKDQSLIDTACFTTSPLLLFSASCLTWRIWMICYDLNFAEANAQEDWISLVGKPSESHSWWIRKRDTFGNHKKIGL